MRRTWRRPCAQTLGIDFNIDESWDEKKEIFKISGKIVSTRNITQSSIVKNQGYTTVIAVASMFFILLGSGGERSGTCRITCRFVTYAIPPSSLSGILISIDCLACAGQENLPTVVAGLCFSGP